MIRTLLSGIMLFAVCSPGLAQQAEAVATSQLSDSNIFHWIITVFGTLWAARLASRAFNRPSVPLADVPTFPMYMTSRIQYQLGSLILIIFACSFFLALVRLHRERQATLRSRERSPAAQPGMASPIMLARDSLWLRRILWL